MYIYKIISNILLIFILKGKKSDKLYLYIIFIIRFYLAQFLNTYFITIFIVYKKK